MVWVVDDLVEAALGPWGLVVGLGVGVLAAARQRRAAVSPTTRRGCHGGWRIRRAARPWRTA